MCESSPKENKKCKLCILDQSFYPDDWHDEQRITNLFSPFRVRTLNPINYDAKMKFWKNLIGKYCLYKGNCIVTINELKKVFQRNDKIPYVFPAVLEDMFACGEIQMKSDFMEIPQHTWSGWAVNSFLKKPLKWGFNKIKEKVVQTKDENTEYVVLEAVKSQGNKIRNHFEHATETVMSLADAIEKCTALDMNAEGALLALHHLDQQQLIFVDRSETIDDYKRIIIKFSATNLKVTPLNELEKSVYNLEKTEKSLVAIIDKCEEEIRDWDEKTRQFVRDGRKNLAKNTLRKRHVAEKNLEKRLNTLEHIQTLLSRIHDTTSDSHIMEAYKIGSKTLKNVLSDSGITLEKVDDTLAEVQEVLELHDDIQTTIGGVQFGTTLDDSELDKELEDLLNEAVKEETEPKPGDVKLPEESHPIPGDANFDESLERRLNALRVDLDDLPEVGKDEPNLSGRIST